jgi:hypothetical protein
VVDRPQDERLIAPYKLFPREADFRAGSFDRAEEENMESMEREYEYKPKWTLILFCALFFGLCAVVLGVKAARNDRGLIINGLFELGPGGATTFYWVLCAGGVGFVVLVAFLAYHRLRFRQRLAFGPAAVTVPVSRWSAQEKEIAYRDISALSTAQISGQRFLYITHPGGRYTITASMLPSKAAFAEVCALLEDKVRVARSVEVNHAKPGTTKDWPRE